MPDTALPAPTVDLAGLIPAQRVDEPEIVPVPEKSEPASVPGPERLAFLWTLVGAVAGSAVVALAFLALLTLLP